MKTEIAMNSDLKMTFISDEKERKIVIAATLGVLSGDLTKK